ncbi:MAG: CHAD domain-containing protein [Betaproteobacteria bacterium]|nr:CHAD domain-containing protein [Betaproteobacteria bacterium]
MAQEIEIKLSVEPEHARRLWGVLKRHPHRKPASRRLFSAYYDTPDRRLQSGGVALRLRREGKRWIQTVKSAGIAAGGLHRRAEHETEVPAQLPNFPAMIEAGFGKLVADKQTREALQVAFTTEFRRSSTLIRPRAGTIIEVSLDRGAIAAGGRRDPICEVELELKAGETDALFDLALEIARGLPVRLDNRSKAQRGYALAARIESSPMKASTPPLSTDMSVDDAFVAVAFHCLAHLQDNEIGLLAGRNPEYFHQARVALRRLRSAFRVFDAAIPRSHFARTLDELKSVARLLGDARDLDVFAVETLPHAGSGRHGGVAALRQRTQNARQRAARAVRTAVAAPEYTAMLLRLTQALWVGQWRGETARPVAANRTLLKFAAKIVSRRYAGVKKRGRPISQLGFADLHRLRIQVKRLRYAIEFFLPLFEDKAAGTLRALVDLQESLGQLNDDATAWKLLDALAAEDSSTDYQQAVGFLRGWCARDGEQCHDQLEDIWKRFDELHPWWESL